MQPTANQRPVMDVTIPNRAPAPRAAHSPRTPSATSEQGAALPVQPAPHTPDDMKPLAGEPNVSAAGSEPDAAEISRSLAPAGHQYRAGASFPTGAIVGALFAMAALSIIAVMIYLNAKS